LTNTNLAVGDPTVDSGARNAESEEPRMIGDFDGNASEFWKLYIGEAKSDDDARINTLKEGMDSALIFVRSHSVRPITGLYILTRGPTGWFIFGCSHSICSRQQTKPETEPRR
jgi:hypothetical protein